MTLPERVKSFCAENRLIPSGARVLCAVSGGGDSVCLLHLLSQWKNIEVRCAHFNHQLRGAESDQDEAFVRDLCQQWNIPLTVGRADVAAYAGAHSLSLEEAGRNLRYAFLEETAGAGGCTHIATAHNADDNAETVLLNLIRGTGLRGLGGIPLSRGKIVRPLLQTTRGEILAYLAGNDLPHREDSSNSDQAYTRNKLRSQVMPLLRELNPKAVEHLGATAKQLAATDRYLEQAVQSYLSRFGVGEGQSSMPMHVLRRMPEPLRPYAILRLLDALPVGRKDFGAVHLEAVLSLRPGGRVHLPHGVTAAWREDLLVLTVADPPPPRMVLPFGGTARWGIWTITLLDRPEGQGLALRACEELTVQPCPPGMRLTLSGANGPRTVKRLCLDQGISLDERDALPAIFRGGKLAAVWPLGVNDAFAPREGEPICFIQIKHTEENET